MPNHITTVLTIENANGMSLGDIRAKFVNGNGLVDFEVIMPTPKCLIDFNPHSGIISRATAALGLLPDPNSLTDVGDIGVLTKRLEFSNAMRDASTKALAEDIPHIIRAISNYAECGFMYWYDWCKENWGTKWNCYGQPEDGWPPDESEFRFQTAWSHPSEMIKIVSGHIPCVTFSVKYADEDIGSNCGAYRIKAGSRFDEDVAPRWDQQSEAEKRRWVEFAFLLLHGDSEDPAAHGYDDNWVYSDDVLEAYESRKSGT